MRVALTGTPGTGKTTVAERVETDGPVVHLNDAIREEDLVTERDADRDSLVADMDAVGAWLEGRDGLVESHLAHRFPADRVVVLRCHPAELETRLRERGEPDATVYENDETPEVSQALARKARENAESEALDVILSEAVAEHGREAVYEIDTTDRSVEAVARDVEAVLSGERDPSAGTVDFTDYL